MEYQDTITGHFVDQLTYRKASIEDLHQLIKLLSELDEGEEDWEILPQGPTLEEIDKRYLEAFERINSNPNQYLMVVLLGEQIVGTCHLTLLPSLSFIGSLRMQIEAVRVASELRGYRIGSWMMNKAIEYAKSQGVSFIQLSANKKKPHVRRFYERLGFEVGHYGMKLNLNEDS